MSQALYRKYRPKKFEEVVGQHHITKTLENEIKTERVVHSYLFTGPRGIGKTTIARLLAKSLNCLERKKNEAEPCNKCQNCLSVNTGNFLNVIEIDAASNTGVDHVRDKIIENVRFAPSGSPFKVFIIDEAHMLSGAAFNALLKTLEEPPEYVVFILATTELQKLPATILSRCQRFDFKKISVKEIAERLKRIAELEKIKIDDKVLDRISYLSEGGLRDAEGLLGQLLGLGITNIKEDDADLVLPKSSLSTALNFLEYLIKRDGRNAIEVVEDVSEKGIDFKYFTDNVIELARKLLYLKITGKGDLMLTADMNKELENLATLTSEKDIVKILSVIIERRGIINNLNIPSLPLEIALAEICGEKEEAQKTINTQVVKQEKGERKELTVSVNDTKKGNTDEIEEKWTEILEKIKDHNHSLPFILNMARPISFDGKNLVLAIKYKLHKDKLEDPKSKSILTEVLKSVYNKDIQVQAEIDESMVVKGLEADEVDVESEFS